MPYNDETYNGITASFFLKYSINRQIQTYN